MKLQRILPFCLLLLTGITACKKTIEAPALPNSRILEYNVPVSDQNIAGVIDESDKTITVYLPFYYELSVIDPKIKISDGATLTGTKDPINVLNDKITYTVTGTDKSTTTYKLVIKIQQDSPLVIKEYSTATVTQSFNIGGLLSVNGNLYTTDINKVKTFLVNKQTGKETELSGSGFGLSISAIDDTYTINSYEVSRTLDSGLYHVKVNKLGLTTTTKYPVRLKYAQPSIIVISANNFKAGETFTIKAANSVFLNFTSFSVTIKGQQVDFPIVSYNRTEAVIKVPETLAPGNYGSVSFTAKFTGFNDFKQAFTLVVVPK